MINFKAKQLKHCCSNDLNCISTNINKLIILFYDLNQICTTFCTEKNKKKFMKHSIEKA